MSGFQHKVRRMVQEKEFIPTWCCILYGTLPFLSVRIISAEGTLTLDIFFQFWLYTLRNANEEALMGLIGMGNFLFSSFWASTIFVATVAQVLTPS